MWPSDRPAPLYQPIANHDNNDDHENTQPKPLTTPRGQLAPKATIPQHYTLAGSHQLPREQLLGGDRPLKAEHLLGGAHPIDKSLLMGSSGGGGGVPIGEHLLLNPLRRNTPTGAGLRRESGKQDEEDEGVEGEEEEGHGLLGFDDVDGEHRHRRRGGARTTLWESGRLRLTMRRAIYLSVAMVALISLVVAACVFATSGQTHPLGPGDYRG